MYVVLAILAAVGIVMTALAAITLAERRAGGAHKRVCLHVKH
jgi:hypothetical protein